MWSFKVEQVGKPTVLESFLNVPVPVSIVIDNSAHDMYPSGTLRTGWITKLWYTVPR